MKIYTVKPNDNLGNIARRFGIPSWKYLYQINKDKIGDNPDMLQVGTDLKIPEWDSTSGDERIKAKGAEPFKYTRGLQYAYPWVPLSISLTNWDGSGVELKEPVEVIIRDRKHNTELWKGTISKFDQLDVLIPDSRDINIGIKGYPAVIGNALHIHPDDEQKKEPSKKDHTTQEAPVTEDGLLRNLGIQSENSLT